MDLSDEQLTQFDMEGFVIIDQIISPTRVDRLAQAMDRVYGGQYNRDIRPAGVRKPLAPFGTERSVRWIHDWWMARSGTRQPILSWERLLRVYFEHRWCRSSRISYWINPIKVSR